MSKTGSILGETAAGGATSTGDVMVFMVRRYVMLMLYCCTVVERDVQGNPLEEARCEVCNGAEPALSAPDSYGDRYQTQPSLPAEQLIFLL